MIDALLNEEERDIVFEWAERNEHSVPVADAYLSICYAISFCTEMPDVCDRLVGVRDSLARRAIIPVHLSGLIYGAKQ